MTVQHPIKTPKKLIEVALPLDAINAAAEREKSIKVGKPTNVHLWWARRPISAARAIIFAQLVNDPASLWELQHPGETPSQQQRGGFTQRRNYLFRLIRELVTWENTTSGEVLRRAREEIRASWRDVCALNEDHPEASSLFNPEAIPGLHDPFAGGGAIPLEAQRLGLRAHASDLNPVAVLINKAMIEVPPRFSGRAPVCLRVTAASARAPELLERSWRGTEGLAEDIRFYSAWMRDEAAKRIGHLYPPLEVTTAIVRTRPDLERYERKKLTVLAWLWARTVKSPNPAFRHVDVPLVSTFVLSTHSGKEAYIRPVFQDGTYHFTVAVGTPPAEASGGTKAPGHGANFRCIMSGTPISADYIRAEAVAGRMGARMMAIVAEGVRERVYVAPTEEMEFVATQAQPSWKPDVEFLGDALGFRIGNYGMSKWSDLYTKRQLLALSTFSDLALEVTNRVMSDAGCIGGADGTLGLESDGAGSRAYSEAVSLYLALGVSRLADWSNALTRWLPHLGKTQQLFSRHAIPMMWDFSELNPLSSTGGSFSAGITNLLHSFERLPVNGEAIVPGQCDQADAQTQTISRGLFVSTDPPYYDNIGYADLSDLFYVWLRRCLRPIYPTLVSTIAVPKTDELVATPARHGSSEGAETFFLHGMTKAMERLAQLAHPAAPVTIYYAFKQSETDDALGTSSTGWDTFLQATIRAGFALTGTWPLRTEHSSRLRQHESNALASSVVLVCRPRPETAETVSRRQFIRELGAVLPAALEDMTKGSGEDQSPVAPVDLSQAIIGPGMAVFSKYASVLEADGTEMTVRTALQLINRFFAEDDFDRDTRFCLHWFTQHGWNEARFGEADTLARAIGTSVDGVRQAGVLSAAGGVVRLLKWADYPTDWDPSTDPRLPVWEALHQAIRVFKTEGESAAGIVIAAIQDKAEATRQLAYRLYTLCERAGWAEDARAYNEIITSWSAIESAAAAVPAPQQTTLFG